jgi:UDP-N-acetylglucosamine pyrophosphorylase
MARPKGARNKLSADVKDNVLAVFNRLGGSATMAEWAQANLSEFYAIYARLLPKQVDATIVEVHEVRIADASVLAERLERALSLRAETVIRQPVAVLGRDGSQGAGPNGGKGTLLS